MTDLGSQTTTRLNAWGWTLTLALVGLGTLACMALGAFLGVTFVANDIKELMSSVDTRPQGIGSGAVEVWAAVFHVSIGVLIGGAIGMLVGLVASTLACRRWLVPRLKLRPKFSRLVASGPAAGM
ncbi:MAG: hypothetical protein K9M08_24115 [Pirellula sp.]|nr:hypothetical protein [Pirellula sp.]